MNQPYKRLNVFVNQYKQSIHYSSHLRYAWGEVAKHYQRLNREMRAAIPKIVIIAPEIRLIHKSH
jgi:hypothetical protein